MINIENKYAPIPNKQIRKDKVKWSVKGYKVGFIYFFESSLEDTLRAYDKLWRILLK